MLTVVYFFGEGLKGMELQDGGFSEVVRRTMRAAVSRLAVSACLRPLPRGRVLRGHATGDFPGEKLRSSGQVVCGGETSGQSNGHVECDAGLLESMDVGE